jgi:hypothetical protein
VATTNSPLTVEGEAVGLAPDVNVTLIARAQKAMVAENFRVLSHGQAPSRGFSRKRKQTLRRIFTRNMNGIGATEALLSEGEPILLTPIMAEQSVKVLDREEREFGSLVLDDRAREEIGSIEGALLEVGTDYNQPAILIRDRRTEQEVWCRVNHKLTHRISQDANLRRGFPAPVGVADRKKLHKFDLGSDNPRIWIECKSHTSTQGGNTPSAKMTVWNECTISMSLRLNFAKFYLFYDHCTAAQTASHPQA